MVFSSPEFLFLFLPIVLALYFGLAVPFGGIRLQNLLLTAASLVFYTWGSGRTVLLLLASAVGNFSLGFLVASPSRARQRLGVAVAVVLNVGLLVYFKYANFFADQVDLVRARLGLGELPWSEVVLPVGISFFTFHAVSYVLDVSRGNAKLLHNPFDFALYLALFPQLIAGPIVRYAGIAEQFVRRRTSLESFSKGARRFALGLVKKVVIADAVGEIANAAFGLPGSEISGSAAWLGVLAYSFQIYFDFSGYSDMAIGLASLFGFRFPENFDRPYSAVSVTDFWRRWHMTLSNWFRDYVYVPLGGSRVPRPRMYANLALVFLLTGLWHGANWTFIVWGSYHGALLIAERVTGAREVERASRVPLRRALTFLLVTLGWVVFRADDLGHAGLLYRAMAGFGARETAFEVVRVLSHRNVAALALASLVLFLPRDFRAGDLVTRREGRLAIAVQLAILLLGMPLAALLVASQTFTPFLYFQF